MKAGGGKQKGSEYERFICKALSLWVSGGQREDLFWRSAMSGGRATVGKKAGKDLAHHAGDISATHPMGHILTDHFYVECKRYADLNFGSFLTKQAGPLAGFWAEAIKQAAAHDRIPMLIVREDRNDTLLIVPCEAMLTRGLTGHVFGFNPMAWIARLHRIKADIYSFDDVLKKGFEAPAKYKLTDRPIATKEDWERWKAADFKGAPLTDIEKARLGSYYDRLDKEVDKRKAAGDRRFGGKEQPAKRIRGERSMAGTLQRATQTPDEDGNYDDPKNGKGEAKGAARRKGSKTERVRV